MPLKPIFNPFTSELQFVFCPPTEEDSPAITNLFDCDAGANVGDLVYQSLTTDKHVLVANDNNTPGPVIGFIKNKPTATTAMVTMIGIMVGITGLIRGTKVFVDTDGTPTTDVPIVNYQQVLGYANSDGQLYFRPEFKRTLKT